MQYTRMGFQSRMWLIVLLSFSGGILGAPPLSQSTTTNTSPAHSIIDSSHIESGSSYHDGAAELMDDFWHWRTQDSPELATQIGINDNTAGRLDSFTEQHFNTRKKKSEEFLNKAEEIPENFLTSTERRNLNILKYQLRTYINNSIYANYLFPVTSLEGPQLQFPRMVGRRMTLASYNDFQKLMSRYGEFPRQADEMMRLMNQSIADKIMPHNLSMVGTIAQFEALNVPVTESVFFQPFLNLPLLISPEQRLTLRQQAQERITNVLLPAFNKLKDFIKDKYIPHARTTPGVSDLPNGDAYYKACLSLHTSTSISPRDIHNLGVSEVKRIHQKLINLSNDLNMSASNASILISSIRSSMNDSFQTPEEALEALQNQITTTTQPHMEELFYFVPPENLTVKGEATDPLTPPMWYERPSIDGTRPGVIYVNSINFTLLSKRQLPASTLKFSYPGFHFHSAVLQASPSIPVFQKMVNSPRVGDTPVAFPHHRAFVEGWGLYSEYLGEDLGLYKDPLHKLGRVERELVAAARLVVDTGIHKFNWSREKALQYFREQTLLIEPLLQEEVRRIITWPGAGCAEKIGEIKIQELRQRAENALGSVDLKEFHDVLLQCTGPLKYVQQCITDYISNNTQKISKNTRPIEVITTSSRTSSVPLNPQPNSSSSLQVSIISIFLIILYFIL